MQNHLDINSGCYWDQRFRENWEQLSGPTQSRFFARLAVDHLPPWLFQEINRYGLTVADWGCAQGDGTDFLSSYIDSSLLFGIDFSAVAIKQAAHRYPSLTFLHQNWLDGETSTTALYDIVFSSNTLEHFRHPYDVLETLARRARKAVALAVPYRELERIHEHFFTFLPENIPLELANGFRLVWSQVIDCRRIPGTHWGGDQIFLLYAAREWLSNRRLVLADCRLEQTDGQSELAALTQRLTETANSLRSELVALRQELTNQSEAANALQSERDDLASRLAEETAARHREREALEAGQEQLSAQSMTVENLKRRCDSWLNRATALENSTSWKLTKPLRILAQATRLLTANPSQTTKRISYLRSRVREDGFGLTAKWLVNRLSKGRAGNIPQIAVCTNSVSTENDTGSPDSTLLSGRDKHYRTHTDAEYRRLSEQMSLDIHDPLVEVLKSTDKRLVIAPVAYDLSLTQRPDHILRALARDDNYTCVFVEINGASLHFTKRDDGIYVTNDIAGLFRCVKIKNPIIYIHYALFAYMLRLFPNAFFIYDVLDDLSISADFCPELERDHAALLRDADVVLFSSQLLQDRYGSKCSQQLLIGNGVWPEDFLPLDPPGEKSSANTLRIGYHGAISELLDFELLDRIAKLPHVELLFLGPVVAFDASQADQLQRDVRRLGALSNVTFLGKRPYSRVRQYLAQIDIGIIPFIPSRATDAVSPLKLFELVAANKPILATPTKTIAQYKDAINVFDATGIVELIKRRNWKAFDERAYASILREHNWSSLVGGLKEILAGIGSGSPRTRVEVRDRKKLDIINVNFFDWNGEVLYKGGAERYVADLAEIAKKRDYAVRIIQKGNHAFERSFQGSQVIGVMEGTEHWNFPRLSRALAGVVSSSDVVVASPLELACNVNGRSRVIGINHGIHWDSDMNRHENKGNYDLIISAAKNSQNIVCVDTNFINWFRTIDWPLAQKLQYVPNYVSEEFFVEEDKDFSGRLNILYPRRLYKARGLYTTLTAFEGLFAEFEDIHLTFCGQADETDASNVRNFMRKYDGRVSWIERDMDEMPSVYRGVHISLIPTMYAEGTSLSCLEALASGNVVVASYIGGLPNLVMDKFNGLLISPDPSSLKTAIGSLASNRAQCVTYSRNGREVARAFMKSRWIQSWTSLLDA